MVFLALASGGILGSALFGQYVLGWYPCELCLHQRVPYVVIIVLAAIGLLFRGKVRAQQILVWLCTVSLLTTAGIAAYHNGVEMKWIDAPSACSSGSSAGLTLEQMRAQIMNAPLVSCDQAMAYIFGLSLAAWNMILSLGLALFSAWAFFAIRKRGLK